MNLAPPRPGKCPKTLLLFDRASCGGIVANHDSKRNRLCADGSDELAGRVEMVALQHSGR